MKITWILLALSLVGCHSLDRITGNEHHESTNTPTPWLAITGTWNGNYSTNKISNVRTTIWINFMSLYDNNFTGVMNDAQTGGIDGSATSNFYGTVDPVKNTFSMVVTSGDPVCGGTFILTGNIVVSPKGPSALEFATISGSNCLGAHTTISGVLN